jgi:hypothetical protein
MFDEVLAVLAEVICYPFGKIILKIVTLGKLEVTLGGRLQPIASLLGAAFLVCLVVGLFLLIN